MTKTITLKESPAAYAAAIEELKSTGEPLIVEQDGKPFAVVMRYAEYQELAALRESEKKSLPRTRDEGFERERAAFLRLKPELLRTHRGLYVAIHDGRVIDADDDHLELAKRVVEKRIEPVYIQLASEEPSVVAVPSPEIVKKKDEEPETWRELQERLFVREIAAYERMKPELLRTHKDKWVAILNGQLVDYADDRLSLSKRVRQKFGDRTMLIEQVRDKPRVYTVDSPERIRG